MADISKITLPSGTTYDIKDETARTAIASINSFDYVLCTNAANTPKDVTWQNGSTTITGTLVASATTKGKMYLVPDSIGTKDIYDEYITVNTSGSTYIWERFGHTDQGVGDLGDLAYKDSASGNFTPAGTVSQPTFTGNELTSTGNYTPAGSVTVGLDTGSYNTTPGFIAGKFTGTSGSVSVSGTPSGTVSAPTISVATAGSTTTVNSITAVGTLPEWTASVTSEVLTISWSAGTLPTKGSNTTVKTGDASYSASQPTFSGNSLTSTGSITPSGEISFGKIETGGSDPSSYKKYLGIGISYFTGISGSVSVTGTPSGAVSQPTFTGTQGTVTVS